MGRDVTWLVALHTSGFHTVLPIDIRQLVTSVTMEAIGRTVNTRNAKFQRPRAGASIKRLISGELSVFPLAL